MIQKLPFQLFAVGCVALLAVGCGSGNSGGNTTDAGTKPAAGGGKTPVKLAFVTNGVSDFWKIADAGIKKATADDPSITVDFRQPPDGTPDQQRAIIDDELTNGVQGIAISPKDPKNQTQVLNDAAKKALVITQDSDAPESDRVCYVGTDNVAAGKQVGEEIKKACPGGGKIMLFVGSLDASNAKERKEGIEQALAGSNITIEDTRTDDGHADRAIANVNDAIVKDPSLVCLVGLWSYNGPSIISALRSGGKLGKYKIVCFDEQAETLAGVKDGSVFATIVQQPYEFGKQAVELMAKYIRGDKSVVPANKLILVPTQVIDQSNLAAFEAKLAEQTKS